MIKIGVLGTGKIAKIHIPNIALDAKLTAIADPYIDKEFVSNFKNITLHTDCYEVIKNPNIDAIFICTPNITHFDFIKACIKEKKAIFCEKPLDLDMDRILEIRDLVEKDNIFLQVGFNRRFDSNFKKMRNLLSSNPAKIITTKIISRDPAHPPRSYVKDSGGLFYDMTIHDFDMLRFLTNTEVEEVFVHGGNAMSNYADLDIDHAMISLLMKDNSFAFIENSRFTNFGYDQRAEVFTSAGNFSCENKAEDNVTILNENGFTKTKPLYFFLERYKDSYKNEVASFIFNLSNNLSPTVGVHDALYATSLAFACTQSYKQKKAIKLQNF